MERYNNHPERREYLNKNYSNLHYEAQDAANNINRLEKLVKQLYPSNLLLKKICFDQTGEEKKDSIWFPTELQTWCHECKVKNFQSDNFREAYKCNSEEK